MNDRHHNDHMREGAETKRLTLAEAVSLPIEEWRDFRACDIALSAAELDRAESLWLWLCGVEADSAEGEVVRKEAREDGALIVALHLPATEFVNWFRDEGVGIGWNCFALGAEAGNDDWAWCVLDRARAASRAFGALAKQCALRPC